MQDYQEILCQAIEIITKEMLTQQSFDITKVYTITDDTRRHEGVYTVTDGSVIFEAYSESTTYYKDTQVYITIPMGDFAAKKMIVGKYQAEDAAEPITYVPLSDKMVVVEESRFAGPLAITANGNSEVPESKDELEINTKNYNIINISANFKTSLSTAIEGHYGLLAVLYNGDKRLTYCLLDSSTFFGNPYRYSTYVKVSKTFDISDLKEPVTKIDYVLYQKDDFKDHEGKLAEASYNNIFVKDIAVQFGFDVTREPDNKVEIFTNDNLEYSVNDKTNKRTINISFYNKTEDNQYLGFTDGNYVITPWWYDYTEIGWREWTPIEGTSFNIELDLSKHQHKYKVIVEELDEENEVLATYESNELVFDNDDPNIETNQKLDALDAMRIIHGANSQDHYALYGGDYRLISGGSRTRTLSIEFIDDIVKHDVNAILNGAIVYWYVPKQATMLIAKPGEDDVLVETGDAVKEGYACYKQEFKELEEGESAILPTFKYALQNIYVEGLKNNTIQCVIQSKNGTIYRAEKAFTFSAAGTFGTDHTIDLRLADGYYGFDYYTPSDEQADRINQCKIDYAYYKRDEGEVSLTKAAVEFQVYDFGYDKVNPLWKITVAAVEEGEAAKDPEVTSSVTKPDGWGLNVDRENQQLQLYIDWNATGDNNPEPPKYPYIQMFYRIDDNLTLMADCVVPCYYGWMTGKYIQAPDTIIYNAFKSEPLYADKLPIKIFSRGNNEDVTTGHGAAKITDHNGAEVNNVDLKIDEKTDCLLVPSYYFLDKDSMVEATRNYAIVIDDAIWPLNILINNYEYSVLNKWDGLNEINDDKGYILTQLVGAGRKNPGDNSYSGVMMGDLQKATDSLIPSNTFGLYGFSDGTITFSLENDGSCSLGDKGQLKLQKENNQWSLSLTPDNFKIWTGQYGNLNNKFLYLSNEAIELDQAFGSLNDTDLWKLCIGNSFGVTEDGILHATGAIIQGDLKVGSSSQIIEINPNPIIKTDANGIILTDESEPYFRIGEYLQLNSAGAFDLSLPTISIGINESYTFMGGANAADPGFKFLQDGKSYFNFNNKTIEIMSTDAKQEIDGTTKTETLTGYWLYPAYGGAGGIGLWSAPSGGTKLYSSVNVKQEDGYFWSPASGKINHGRYALYYYIGSDKQPKFIINDKTDNSKPTIPDDVKYEDIKIGYVTGQYGDWLTNPVKEQISYTWIISSESTLTVGSKLHISDNDQGYLFFGYTDSNDRNFGLLLGNSNQYALQIGAFKVHWNGHVEYSDPGEYIENEEIMENETN